MSENRKLPNGIHNEIILDDQGGSQISVRDDGKSPTLRAEAHGNIPCVIGVDSYNLCLTGDVGRTISTPGGGLNEHIPCVMAVDGYNAALCEKSPTLGVNCGMYTGRNGIVMSAGFIQKDKSPTLACTHDGAPAVAYSVQNHSGDSRVEIDESGKCQTLTSRIGTGGGNEPLVMIPFCKSRRSKSPDDFTTWKDAKVANTLNVFDQGEVRANELVVFCLQGNCVDRQAKCNGRGWREDVSFSLNTIDRHAVCIGNGQADQLKESPMVGALNCMHDQQAVMCKEKQMGEQYVVRRLTPLECCRLQGFPDGYAEIDHKDDFSEEECKFWAEVRRTYELFNGREPKEYTKAQLLKWYNGLHTDSAEYKMWGNGIGLPTALYVMQGIADCLNE